MIDDFDLIVSSFLSQYGIRIYSEGFRQMKWDEFCSLLRGLSADTPLGRIVQIRSESNLEILKNFTPHQRKIRSEWRNRQAKQVTTEDRDIMLEQLKQAFISMSK